MFLKRANASLSFPPPIYKPSMEEARWGAVSPRNACPSAQHSGQMLAFEGKTRSHSRAFTISLTGSGNWAECSTELAPIIEFLAQGSIKPEPRWLVPLRQPKMPENEWKPMLCLFH